jgi:effector-binding domain-containing protein
MHINAKAITIPMKDSNGLISIGTFSMITRLTKRALRLYDEKGLLSPTRKDLIGYRQYSYNQICRGLQLKRLADLGFGIQEMKEIMDSTDGFVDKGKLDTFLSKRIEDVNIEMNRLEKIRESLLTKSFLEVIHMEKNEPVLKNVPSLRVLSRREKGTYQEVIPRLISELSGIVFSPDSQQTRVRCNGPPLTIYHDNEHKENDADIEAAIPISGNITVGPEYEVKTLDECKVVSYIYKGPYPDVGPAWKVVFEYIDRKGLRVADNCRELYLNDPKETPETELLTEIQVPVEE